MALYVKQDDNRTKLQEKIAADLREKAIRNSLDGDGDIPPQENDGVEDSAYLEGTKGTTSLAFVWLLIFVAAVLALILFFIFA